jgi:hypothetical protein
MWTLQHILVYIIVILAVGYLLRKYVWSGLNKNKDGKKSGDCGPDCGCH